MVTTAELTTPTRSFIAGLADVDGHLAAEPLFAAAEAAGFSTTKLRLAIKRMVDGGLLTTTGRGRGAELRLTEAGLADRAPDLAWTAVAYRADAGLDRWDGRWHLAAFEIPERQRAARDALRTQITDLYGGALSGGLYVSPLAWEPWLDAVANTHGVADRLTTLETTALRHGGRTEPRAVAAIIWPVLEVDRAYRAFIERWSPVVADIPTAPALAVRVAFEANAEFETAIRSDPLLPVELAPDGFAGPAARRLLRELGSELAHHEILARANLFQAYDDAIATAIAEEQTEFWGRVFTETQYR